MATKENAAVLMVDNNGKILSGRTGEKTSLKDALNKLGAKKLIAIGGNKSIADKTLKGLENVDVQRIGGRDRFETALNIAKATYPESDNVMVANGNHAVDALSAGAVTAQAKSPIILVEKDNIPENISSELKGKKITVLGGVKTLSDKLVEKLNNL